MEKIYKFLVTFFYLGCSPYAPGTMGTLGAAALYGVLWALNLAHVALLTILLVSVSLLTCWLGTWAEHHVQKKDPQFVVLDEVAGFFLTVILFRPSWVVMVGGFFLFRLFDIWKPYPIHKLEQLPGGVGILVDDLMAGVYGLILLLLGSYLARQSSMSVLLQPALWAW
jgi:phosphatidylglycerophosphatase A